MPRCRTRRADWLVTVAGHSRYLWSAEIYQGANHYGRYLTHGSMQLLADGDPVSAFGSGFRQEGWDWRHIPGTTALEIPMERMKADIRNVDTASGYEEMLLSDEALRRRRQPQGPRRGVRDGTPRARQIQRFVAGAQVVVFLRQPHRLYGFRHRKQGRGRCAYDAVPEFSGGRGDPLVVNGEAVTQFPYRAELAGGAVLRDNLRNAYFVPKGRVVVSKSLQRSLDEETDAPTQNNFATAWIDHGSGSVSGGGYEYMLAVHASDEEAARYARELPYEVLRRDASAHILRDKPSGITGYALFAAGKVGEGLLESVSLPSLVMIGGDGEGLTVSAADPDLRFYEGPSDEVFDADGRRASGASTPASGSTIPRESRSWRS